MEATNSSISVAKLNIIDLLWQAGPVVKLVLLLLIVMSAISLAIVWFKWVQYKKVQKANVDFLKFFKESESLEAVYNARDRFRKVALARVFNQGYRECSELGAMTSKNSAETSTVGNIERRLQSATHEELLNLESLLPLLAITASSAPFIGLFGTVWGIMHAFLSIGAKGTTTLAVVAPGIAEALIATAIGLFAAIPAAVFYNLLVNRLRRVKRSFDGFTAEFINTVVRGHFAKGER